LGAERGLEQRLSGGDTTVCHLRHLVDRCEVLFHDLTDDLATHRRDPCDLLGDALHLTRGELLENRGGLFGAKRQAENRRLAYTGQWLDRACGHVGSVNQERSTRALVCGAGRTSPGAPAIPALAAGARPSAALGSPSAIAPGSTCRIGLTARHPITAAAISASSAS